MASATSLLDWILSILRDPEERAAFERDPPSYAERDGFGDLTAADMHDALCLIADNQSASYDDDIDHVRYPQPHHYDHHEDAATYLSHYVTNEYTIVDDRDTPVDNSVHQDIDTDGGDFDQTIDNDPVVASGDGAVAAGDDIRDSQVTTGDDNVVGDDNQVSGDDGTTAFGRGDATDADFSDARFGDGSGVSLGGDARGSASDDDTETSVRGGDGDTGVSTADDDSDARQDVDRSDDDHVDDDHGVDQTDSDHSHATINT